MLRRCNKLASPSFVQGNPEYVVASLQAQIAFAVVPVVLADALLSAPCAEKVYVSDGRDGVYHVWTIVDSPPDEEYDAIYDREKALIRKFSPLQLDFRVVAREGRDLSTLVTLPYQVWSKHSD